MSLGRRSDAKMEIEKDQLAMKMALSAMLKFDHWLAETVASGMYLERFGILPSAVMTMESFRITPTGKRFQDPYWGILI
jgi:hypothetical protein